MIVHELNTVAGSVPSAFVIEHRKRIKETCMCAQDKVKYNVKIDNRVWIYETDKKISMLKNDGIHISISLTWFAITHALLTASASTSSGRDISWPSGPVTPAASNFLTFCNKFMTIKKAYILYFLFSIANCNIFTLRCPIQLSNHTSILLLNFLFTFHYSMIVE